MIKDEGLRRGRVREEGYEKREEHEEVEKLRNSLSSFLFSSFFQCTLQCSHAVVVSLRFLYIIAYERVRDVLSIIFFVSNGENNLSKTQHSIEDVFLGLRYRLFPTFYDS